MFARAGARAPLRTWGAHHFERHQAEQRAANSSAPSRQQQSAATALGFGSGGQLAARAAGRRSASAAARDNSLPAGAPTQGNSRVRGRSSGYLGNQERDFSATMTAINNDRGPYRGRRESLNLAHLEARTAGVGTLGNATRLERAAAGRDARDFGSLFQHQNNANNSSNVAGVLGGGSFSHVGHAHAQQFVEPHQIRRALSREPVEPRRALSKEPPATLQSAQQAIGNAMKDVSSKPNSAGYVNRRALNMNATKAGDPRMPVPLVRGVCQAEEPNPMYRMAMEDAIVCQHSLGGDGDTSFYAVYDGHGGKQSVDYIAAKLHDVLHSELLKANGDMKVALERAFLRIDDQLRCMGAYTTGSTAAVAIIRRESNPDGGHKRVLYVANVGDTRAVIGGIKVERLSYDHKGLDVPEINRVQRAGGMVLRGRLSGTLAVTRAFGDHALKKDGLIATPHIVRRELKDGGPQSVLVIASDGLWDVVTDEEAISCAGAPGDSMAAKRIVNLAMKNQSRDNIAVLCLTL